MAQDNLKELFAKTIEKLSDIMNTKIGNIEEANAYFQEQTDIALKKQ